MTKLERTQKKDHLRKSKIAKQKIKRTVREKYVKHLGLVEGPSNYTEKNAGLLFESLVGSRKNRLPS